MKFVVTGADTWTGNGLRGSGSDDWMVNDHFIPEERTRLAKRAHAEELARRSGRESRFLDRSEVGIGEIDAEK